MNKPKISIFLPTYNKEKYIRKAISSIQNQTLKDIEIIAVNDCSNDKTLEILKNLSLTDKRIKIVNNKNNSGLLYSRAMGIIHSSGEYLMNLDPDDELKNLDNLEYLYDIANKSNLDIVEFSYYIRSIQKDINVCREFNTIITQPQLFESIYNDDNTLRDYLITNKLIKREIFFQAYKLFYNYIYNGQWNFHEDNIWSIIVHKLASTKICVQKLIYVYNDDANKESLTKNIGSSIEYNNYIYRFDMIRQIYNSKIYIKYIIRECIAFIEKIQYSIEFRRYIEINEGLRNKTSYNLNHFINYYNLSKYFKDYNLNNIIKINNKDL